MLLERDEHALRTDLTEVDVQLIGRDGQPGPWPAGRRLLAGPGPGRPRPPIGADRLVLHSKNLPLPAEVLLASAVGASWVYYRGARCISRPLAGINRHRDGIPFLAPEVVLLFKSRSESDKDQRDVETAMPVLNADSAQSPRHHEHCQLGKPRLCPAGEITGGTPGHTPHVTRLRLAHMAGRRDPGSAIFLSSRLSSSRGNCRLGLRRGNQAPELGRDHDVAITVTTVNGGQ